MQQTTRIKICGITRAEDLDRAVEAGADAIGLVFVPGSPRALAPAAAASLRRRLPPFVSAVALLMDAEAETVRAVVEAVAPDLLQFHGAESAAFCSAFGRPYIKAVAAADGADLEAAARAHPEALGLLVDGHGAGEMGGSGRRVRAQAVAGREALSKPLVLAGGLNPDNVGDAIRQWRPWAVDVSSGVESAPGIKCPERMRAFIHATRQADEQAPAD